MRTWLVATDQGITTASSVAPRLLISGRPFSRVYWPLPAPSRGVYAKGDACLPAGPAPVWRMLAPPCRALVSGSTAARNGAHRGRHPQFPGAVARATAARARSEEHTSELQS